MNLTRGYSKHCGGINPGMPQKKLVMPDIKYIRYPNYSCPSKCLLSPREPTNKDPSNESNGKNQQPRANSQQDIECKITESLPARKNGVVVMMITMFVWLPASSPTALYCCANNTYAHTPQPVSSPEYMHSAVFGRESSRAVVVVTIVSFVDDAGLSNGEIERPITRSENKKEKKQKIEPQPINSHLPNMRLREMTCDYRGVA